MNKVIWIVALLGSMNTFAQETPIDLTGYYVGGKFGVIDIDNEYKTNSWGLQVGYFFNQYLSVEAGYISALHFKYDSANFETSSAGYSVAIIPTMPINEDWSVHGKIGYMRTESEVENGAFEDDNSQSGLLVGLGATRHIGQTFVRAEFERIKLDGDYTDQFTVGFGVRF